MRTVLSPLKGRRATPDGPPMVIGSTCAVDSGPFQTFIVLGFF